MIEVKGTKMILQKAAANKIHHFIHIYMHANIVAGLLPLLWFL